MSRAAMIAGLLVAGSLAGCSSASASKPSPSPTVPASGYSALGDSYSSGEGTGEYEAGSAVKGDDCHRSTLAYPPLLDSAGQLGKLTFVACSGAVTSDLIAANHDGDTNPSSHAVEPAQISSIPVHTKIVTLTIGGNDAGFASVLEHCVTAKVGPISVFPDFFASFNGCHDNATLNRTVASRLHALSGTTKATAPDGTPIIPISELLTRIHQRAPQAKIYVAGYPALFGSTSNSCHVGDVEVVHVPLVGDVSARLTISAADTRWLNEVAGRFNGVLRAAADKAPATTFVDVSQQFDGHRLCDSGASWIASVTGHADIGSRTGGLDPGSIHPTRDGQRGYEAALVSAGVS